MKNPINQSHKHNHNRSYSKAFAIGIGLNLVFVAVEVVYGLVANSSALLADAGHNATDVLSLVFAWSAAWFSTIKPKGKYTYGLRKTTILVSFLNALILFGAVFGIGWDAFGNLGNPEPVGGKQIMVVAGIGVLINTFTALMFMRGQKDDLNIKGAFLHMAADAAVSLGVVVAGLLIHITGIQWIDSVASFLIIIVILWATWGLLTDSIDLALDAVPKHIELERVRDFLLSKKGVEGIHDLHIWAMSTTETALTVHMIMPGGYEDVDISEMQDELKLNFGIGHATIQIENEKIKSEYHADC